MAQSVDDRTAVRELIEAAIILCEKSLAHAISANALVVAGERALARSRDLITRVK